MQKSEGRGLIGVSILEKKEHVHEFSVFRSYLQGTDMSFRIDELGQGKSSMHS